MQKQHIAIALVFSLLLAAVYSAPDATADILLKAVGKNEISLRPKTMDSQIDIHGQIAQIKTTLTMASELDIQSEADFEYTVPDNTLVTYFAYWYKGEKVIARIVTKERAAEIYRIVSNAKDKRQRHGDPALVEMEDKNTFHVRIFPIEANADLKVEIHSVQLLDSDAKGSLFTFPLKTPKKNKGTFEKIHLHLQLYPDNDVAGISNNYNLPLIRSNNIQTLDLQQQNWRAPQDLKVRFSRPAKALNASLYSARAGGADGFFALTLIPSQDIPKPRLEIQGIKTRQLLPTKLAPMKAHVPVLVTGRYSGNGAAKVLLHGYGKNGVLAGTAKVLFSSQTAQPNAAAQFGAKLQMQHLATNPKNKSAVMQLSKRFNLPSKYTSWLALPEEGRKIYEKNLAENDLAKYAPALVNLIAAGKGNIAKARALRKLVEQKSAIAGVNPDNAVARYLAYQIDNTASDIVRQKEKEHTSLKYVQQKQHYLNMLLSYIPTHTNRYIKSKVNEIAKTDYRNAVDRYVENVQAGKKDMPSSQALLGRIKRLYAEYPSKDDEGLAKPKDAIRNEANSNVWELLQNITAEKVKDTPDAPKMQAWGIQLKRLVDETGISTDSMIERTNKNIFEGKIRTMIGYPMNVNEHDYAGKITVVEKALPKIGEILNIDKKQQRQLLEKVLYQDVQPLSRDYYSLQDKPEKNAEKRVLHDQLASIAQALHVPFEDIVDNNAKLWARQQVYNLPRTIIDEKGKENSNTEKIQSLEDRLNRVAQILQYKPTHFTDTYESEFAAHFHSDKTANDYIEEAEFDKASASIENSNRILSVEKKLTYPDVEYDKELEASRQKIIKTFSAQTQARLKNVEGSFPSSLWTVRDLLLREYRKENPDELRAKELKEMLVSLGPTDWYLTSQYTTVRKITNPTLFENLRAQRLELRANREKIEDKIKSETDPSRTKTLQDQRAEIMVQQKKLIARMGDPLISVQAPDAVSVVALMPDGQIKQLVFDAQKNRWEARFDIPASAAEGEYTIQIIVVRKDNSRQMLTMHYSVDLTPPTGNAQIKVIDKNYSGQKVLRLEMQTDENAARVSALLPWNTKVELMPSENTSNQFFALTPVPEGYGKSTFPVTFVLTDKAHNRAEITVLNK